MTRVTFLLMLALPATTTLADETGGSLRFCSRPYHQAQ